MRFERTDFFILLGSIPVISAALWGLLSLGDGLYALGLLALPVGALLLGRKLFNTPYLSPVTIVVGILTIIAGGGYSLRDLLAQAQGRGASIDGHLTDEQMLQTVALIAIFGAIIALTAALSLALTKTPPTTVVASSVPPVSWEAKPPAAGMVLLAAVPLVLILAGTSLDDLILRPYYVVGERGTVLGSIGPTLATAVLLLVGYIYGAGRGGQKFLALCLLATYSIALMSFGSRRFALIPILFAVGVFLARNNKRTKAGVLVGVAMAAFLLPLPLLFRNSVYHGLIPYTDMLSKITPADGDWLGALNNVFVAFLIIGMTAFNGRSVEWSDLFVAIDPMPGGAAGWYQIAPTMRLNAYTPMAAIGELGTVGWDAVILFAIGMGIALAWVERSVARQILSGSHVYSAILIALTALFALQMVQYNLRSAVRILLYLIVLEACRRFWAWLQPQMATPESRGLGRGPTTWEKTLAAEVKRSRNRGLHNPPQPLPPGRTRAGTRSH